jgi:catechol 2,3-dioxygenase-like lactoylglutathione lyase family enzyme
MIKELNHVAIRVADMEAGIRFYRDILGGTVIRDESVPSQSLRFVLLQVANGVIELMYRRSRAIDNGLQHIGFRVAEDRTLDDVAEHIKGLGYRFELSPRESSTGNGRIAFFMDKSGVIFELVEREGSGRIPGLKNERIISLDHIMFIVCEDDSVGKNFYVEELGFTLRNTYVDRRVRRTYYTHGPDTIETLYTPGRPRAAKPLGHISFHVADCAEMKAYLEANGVVCGRLRDSTVGGFKILHVVGPGAETIEFMDRSSLQEYEMILAEKKG